MGSTFFSKRFRPYFNTRKSRPKTFKSEEAAKKYAEEHNLKDYEIENLKSSDSTKKKIRIVLKK